MLVPNLLTKLIGRNFFWVVMSSIRVKDSDKLVACMLCYFLEGTGDAGDRLAQFGRMV